MPTTTKSQWRSRLRSARQSMDDAARHLAAEQLASAGAGWATHLHGTDSQGTVCAYISTGSEPGTGPLLRSLHESGHGVYVPVCEPGHQLSWTQWSPGIALERSLLAPVMEPVGRRLSFARLGTVDGILLPALAVDTTGVRLGQGGGYYDRFLASLASPTEDEGHAVPTAAVVHVQEVFEEGVLPHDELDRRVDWMVTPSGWNKTGPTPL